MVRVGELEAHFLRPPPAQFFLQNQTWKIFCIFPGPYNLYFQDIQHDFFHGWLSTGLHDRYKQGKIEASEVQDNLQYRTLQKPKDTEKNPIKTLTVMRTI